MRKKSSRRLLAGAVASTLLAISLLAHSSPVRFGPHDVASLFSITKSENKNEVMYAVHLDAQCSPSGEAPVFAYWRLNEKGPGVLEPLLPLEEKAYGIERQRVLSNGGPGGKVELALRAVPTRPIVILTAMNAGRCEARSFVTISGESALLSNVYVKLSGLRMDYVLLLGLSADRRRVVREKLTR